MRVIQGQRVKTELALKKEKGGENDTSASRQEQSSHATWSLVKVWQPHR